MTTTHVPGWIELDGVDNMRDVGALPTTDGGAVVAGRLIRSDNLQELPPASVRHLVDDLAVTDVVDLRTVVEVAKEGDGPMLAEPGVRIHHHTLYTEDTKETGIPAGERKLPWEADRNMGTAAKVRPPHKEEQKHDAYWSQHYLGYLDRRPDSVVAALRAIGEADGAVVVHCAAGKDRTGTVIGLALLVAGVTPEAVIADFAASAERVPRIMQRLARHPVYAANLEGKTVAQQAPRAETMRLLVEALDREGGPETWLRRHGWTDDDTQRLRAKLLTP
ncbi:MAG TPA: tyrosine-protein phosphatase [Lapillicoccus sp.]|uniref:tyrosine-protein phosphatase n=1 Tax=Lapillicoccus sp. TaxID=1909287 RepID=UPI002F9548C7